MVQGWGGVGIRIKRLIRKRDKLFRLAKHAGMGHLTKRHLALKHLIKQKIKSSYNTYLETILGINNNNPEQS